jgi:pSer/pThr/pTyr-binding forkhead associated (FHA) protein
MNLKLLVVHGRPQGKSFLFPPGEYYFGRGAECHIQPNSELVSRQHCLLRVTAEHISVRDLGSRNGTLVNGKRVMEERPLVHGDQLQVGPLVFEIHVDESVPLSSPSLPETSSPLAPTIPNIDCRDTAEQPAAPGAPSEKAVETPAESPVSQ